MMREIALSPITPYNRLYKKTAQKVNLDALDELSELFKCRWAICLSMFPIKTITKECYEVQRRFSR